MPESELDFELTMQVDRYLERELLRQDHLLERVLATIAAEGMPAISVSPLQGMLLHLLVRISGARRVLEVGTLGGYSAIWMARALPPGGSLLSLELDAHHARVAQHNLAEAAPGGVATVRLGDAVQSLNALAEEHAPAYDFFFIDGEKSEYPAYLEGALRLARPGAVIVLDNVVRGGEVADSQSADARVRGVREALRWLGSHPRLEATALQTVGGKGYDGLAVALVGEQAGDGGSVEFKAEASPA